MPVDSYTMRVLANGGYSLSVFSRLNTEVFHIYTLFVGYLLKTRIMGKRTDNSFPSREKTQEQGFSLHKSKIPAFDFSWYL